MTPEGPARSAEVGTSGDGVSTRSPGASAPGDATQSRAQQIGVALTGIAVSLLWCWGAVSFDIRVEQPGIGPRTWPLMIGGGALLLSLVLLAQALMGVRPPREGEPVTRLGIVRAVITVGATAVALAAWLWSVPYLIWMPLLMICLILAYGARGWKAVLLVPGTVLLVIFLLFDLLLKVPL